MKKAPAKSEEEKKHDLTQQLRIMGLLEERYREGRIHEEWVFFREFNVGEGRKIDAFAMNCWNSKHYRRIAFEIKVSRADFLNELKDHTKRQPAIAISNEFFFVTLPGVVQPGEIPEACGHMEAQANGLKIRKAAHFREQPPTIPIHAIISPLRDNQSSWDHIKGLYLWRYAGRDLTREEFLEVVREEMPVEMEVQIEERAQKKFENWKEKREEYQIAKVILDEMGTSFNAGPDRVLQWLRDQRQGVPLNELTQLPYHLKELLEIWTEKIEPRMKEREENKKAAKQEKKPDENG